MPLPTPRDSESEKDFISRCMSALAGEFPDDKQRSAVCYRQFRGDSAKHAQSLVGVEVFRPGRWNGKDYTDQDIDDLVSSFNDLGYVPPIKLGHDDASGAMAYGWVKNLRKDAGKAIADLTDLPDAVYNAIKEKRYNTLSAEIFFNLQRDKKIFRRALKAIALLGAEIPAVSGLKPLSESIAYGTKDYEEIHFQGTDNMDEVTKLKEEIATLKATIVELRSKLSGKSDDEHKKTMDKMSQQIADREADIVKAATRIAALESQLLESRIADKVSNIQLPVYKEAFTALYKEVNLSKVVKFAEGEKTIEKILDDLVTKISEDASDLFKERGNGGSDRLSEESPDAKLSRLIDEYIDKHDSVDYFKAREQVFKSNPDLAKSYVNS